MAPLPLWLDYIIPNTVSYFIYFLFFNMYCLFPMPTPPTPPPRYSLSWFATLLQPGEGGNAYSSFKMQFSYHLLSKACPVALSHFSRVQLVAALWNVACQAPVSMGFFRQEYWSGLLCPPPGDLPDPGMEPASLKSPAFAFDCAWQVGSLPWATWEAPYKEIVHSN